MLTEHEVFAETMRKTFAKERLLLDEQRVAVETQRRADAEVMSAWEVTREQDIGRIAEARTALMECSQQCREEVARWKERTESAERHVRHVMSGGVDEMKIGTVIPGERPTRSVNTCW